MAEDLHVSFNTQLRVLTERAVTYAKREPKAIISKVGQSVFIGILCNLFWWKVGGDYSLQGI